MSGEPSNKNSNSIVIRFPNWIGDCVMALPALRTINRCLPQAEIYVVAKEYLRGFFQNITEIKEIIYIPNRFTLRGMLQSAAVLKSYTFDRGILFTNSFASAFLFRMGGINELLGYKRDWRGFLLSRKLEFPRNNKHHHHFYLDLAKEFCLEPRVEADSDQLIVNRDEQRELEMHLAEMGIEPGKSWLGLSPSAAYGTAKEWLPENFTQLLHCLRENLPECQILLFGSNKESDKIDAICRGLDERVINLAGKLTLRQSITAISLCRVFISNDSGLMHVAASLRIPLVAIFGPTLPHKTGPLSPLAQILFHEVHCAPCLYRECPHSHQCMKAITVGEVMQAVESLWQD